MDENALLDLVGRMNGDGLIVSPDGEGYTSEGSVSWNAMREAETLYDPSIIPIAMDLVTRLKSHNQRDALYKILAHLGRRLDNRDVFSFLIERLSVESNKYVLSSLLAHLAALGTEYRGILSVEQLIPYATHSAWQVKYDAIQVFHLCDPVEAECFLRAQLDEQAHNPFALTYLMGELTYVGSEETIPSLVKLVDHPNGDLASSAIRTLTTLGDASLFPLYIQAMGRRSIEVKYDALMAILKHGDERALPVVINRVKQLVRRKRVVEHDDLIVAMTFLSRYIVNDEVRRLFLSLYYKKWEVLFPAEQEWLRKHQSLVKQETGSVVTNSRVSIEEERP